jgi:hypothetical protein
MMIDGGGGQRPPQKNSWDMLGNALLDAKIYLFPGLNLFLESDHVSAASEFRMR